MRSLLLSCLSRSDALNSSPRPLYPGRLVLHPLQAQIDDTIAQALHESLLPDSLSNSKEPNPLSVSIHLPKPGLTCPAPTELLVHHLCAALARQQSSFPSPSPIAKSSSSISDALVEACPDLSAPSSSFSFSNFF